MGVARRGSAVAVDRAGPPVVVTPPSGYASALAQALDEGSHPGIAGTIAGDNTIFVAPREGTTAAALGDELLDHLDRG
jgi:transcriptional regulator of arginine metabolism